jgi:putative transposase
MARPLRVVYPGAFYHVTARGNERRRIFLSQGDYAKFLSYVADAVHKYDVILHAFVLMANHFHLLVETPRANLSAFMHAVNSAYTTYFNIRRKRTGHLFQGRFKSILVERDPYLLEVSRYLHLNPVRAGIVAAPEAYPQSSYRSYIAPKDPAIVSRDLTWGMIANSPKEAAPRYKAFVESALVDTPPNPFTKVYGGALLGTTSFIKDVLDQEAVAITKNETAKRRVLAATTSGLTEIITLLSRHFAIPEATVLQASPYRSYAIYLARKHTPMSSADIGRAFAVTCSAVSKIGTRMKQRLEDDGALRETLQRIKEELSNVNG